MTTYTDRFSGFVAGVAYKAPARVATTAPITLSGLQVIDGVTLENGDRVLVKDQANAIDNGVWIVSAGTWTRAADMDGAHDVTQGTQLLVNEGAANGDLTFRLMTAAPVIGSSALAFAPSYGKTVASQAVTQATGDGSTTAFAIPAGSVSAAASTDVFVDGVYQNKSGWTLAGAALTFNQAPPVGAVVEIVTAIGGEMVTAVTTDRGDVARPLGAKMGDVLKLGSDVAGGVTFRIPTDFPTLEAAFDACSGYIPTRDRKVTLLIESGHALTKGVLLDGGDYRHVRITAEDDVIYLAAGFTGYGDAGYVEDYAGGAPNAAVEDCLFVFRDCDAPRIACLFDMSGQHGDGLYAMDADISVEMNCGVRNAGRHGLHTRGATGYAFGADFSGAQGCTARIQHCSSLSLQKSNLSGGGASLTDSPAPVFISRGSNVNLTECDCTPAVETMTEAGLEAHRARVVGTSVTVKAPIISAIGSDMALISVDATGATPTPSGFVFRVQDGSRLNISGASYDGTDLQSLCNVAVNAGVNGTPNTSSFGEIMDDEWPSTNWGVLSIPAPVDDLNEVRRTGLDWCDSDTLNQPEDSLAGSNNSIVLTVMRAANRFAQLCFSTFPQMNRMWARAHDSDGDLSRWREVVLIHPGAFADDAAAAAGDVPLNGFYEDSSGVIRRRKT